MKRKLTMIEFYYNAFGVENLDEKENDHYKKKGLH